MNRKILIVDDEAASRYGMRRALEKEGFIIYEAENTLEAESQIELQHPQVVLLDIKLSHESGLEYLPKIIASPNPPMVIMITAHGSEKLAVEAIKKGAYNYLAKPFDVEELRIIVKNASETFILRQENFELKTKLAETRSFGSLIGSSPLMRRVYSLIEKVAQTNVSVLITGESGTGKDVVAREIHMRGSEREGNFVAINCAAMPENLIESELFGHEKGAFTGASSKRIGKFEAANKGTLFLDEIGDMSLVTQAKVLRVLEDKSFQRLGSNESLSSDVRIISATNKDLEREVEAQRFRADLFYRLAIVTIHLPPIRERKEEIPELVHHFLSTFAVIYKKKVLRISKDAMNQFLNFEWPGNIRQLKNCIERAVVLSETEEITLNELPSELLSKPRVSQLDIENDYLNSMMSVDYQEAKKAFERFYIENCLKETSGNITQAALRMGIHRQSLQHKIKELGLTKKFTRDLES
jgi:DNA-binding NtrC family response regulator